MRNQFQRLFAFSPILILPILLLWVSSNSFAMSRDATIESARNNDATPIRRLPEETSTQWTPVIEWDIENEVRTSNPFDVIADVTFTHTSGITRTTQMFYAGDNIWKFRFSGDLIGFWSLQSQSNIPELDGWQGRILIEENPNVGEPGFVSSEGNKWIRTGTEEAFVPQLVMFSGPNNWYDDPEYVDQQINLFFNDHGFNGVHVPLYCRWYDMENSRCNQVNNSNPDFDTFAALEMLITKVYAAGGTVHFWVWGDADRGLNPLADPAWDGLNGIEDQRIQRYIAARLGPLPGWTLGYGFDLDEWVDQDTFHEWHDNMANWLSWPHLLSGRPAGPNSGTDHTPYVAWNSGLGYSSYEHHKPDYAVYVAALEAVPGQPVMSEDRFRIRDEGRVKDYTMEETRRGLWHSTMAGGVANIWGDLIPDQGNEQSGPYDNPEMIKTWSLFWNSRFTNDLVRDNTLTDGVALTSADSTFTAFYKEDATSVELTLPDIVTTWEVVAIDTKLVYDPILISLQDLAPQRSSVYTWQAPYASDWAIAARDLSPTAVEAQFMSARSETSLADFAIVWVALAVVTSLILYRNESVLRKSEACQQPLRVERDY
jgi:hypothetical protein